MTTVSVSLLGSRRLPPSMPLLLLLLLPPLPPLLLPRLMVFPGSMSFIVIGVPEEATEAVEEEAAEVLADVLDFRVRTVLPFFLP